MGTLYQGSPLHKTLRLRMGGSCVSDYIKNVATKDKPEEKGAKAKHAPTNKGIQAEGKNSLEENKREKKLDDGDGAREKVNVPHMVPSNVNCSLHMKDKMAQSETTKEARGQANSSKSCQKQKDIGVNAVLQNNSISCISGGNLAGSQNTGQNPGLEDPLKKHVNPKLKESENNISKPKENENSVSRFSTPAGETVPSTSKCGSEVIRTRLSINVQLSDDQDKASKSREGGVGGHRGKSSGASASLSSPLGGEGAKHLPDSCKAKQPSKNSRTEPAQEAKGGKPSKKQGEQEPKLMGPPPLAKAEGKAEIKCKTVSCLDSAAKDSGKDPGGKVKSHKETTKITKVSVKDGISETEESSSSPVRREDGRPSQGAGKPTEDASALGAGKVEEVIIDDSPPPPAPFEHRIVSIKQTELTTCYLVCHHEVLGGGRFGQVHKCTEKSTGLCLAAKIIKVKAAKEREEVKNEINIMNQLNHVNLIQLYDAFESKNNLTLIMEYVDGGELFDRITDENYNLTELDAILFTKQICEGIYYLHQQYILHLDLKPENILCVNCTGNQIKIIDFGLARRYKPREKLKVNFGTPEFLAPEVVNYDFVSFPTDMWSVGVIAYMLVSGLSPFLGETDTETMNYIVNCSWDFDAEAFEQVSEEAKDFVSRLLVKGKSGRTSAANCLKHEWLMDLPGKAKKTKACLKSQLLLQRYMAQRKWKKHFYVVAAANRLRRFPSMSESPA
ncbi:myosin light chain kinase 3 isoform X2 [Rhineura floridana]|uniref:myosin light chain kinase 3 isoform X2 n=1 Tax=Rhineura floridana TaxID=261503 RepID=UPI002AC83D62|nr:myosin light chain kinase 3 isoform X2 [Rhineura floridana]